MTTHNAGLPDERVEVGFEQPPEANYRHLTRDFFVEPKSDYVLDARVRAEDLVTRDGMRLVLAGPRRFIGSSIALRGTTTWKPVTFRFRTLPGEHVVRLAVVNDATGRAKDTPRGRFEVRGVTLRGAP